MEWLLTLNVTSWPTLNVTRFDPKVTKVCLALLTCFSERYDIQTYPGWHSLPTILCDNVTQHVTLSEVYMGDPQSIRKMTSHVTWLRNRYYILPILINFVKSLYGGILINQNDDVTCHVTFGKFSIPLDPYLYPELQSVVTWIWYPINR